MDWDQKIIAMEGVSWVCEGSRILTDIHWEVMPGEHWAVVGLNGSGKTSLLNMVNGYIRPSQGEMSVLGHRFGEVDLRQLRKSIGWVSSSLQERLYATETALEIVLSGRFATIGLYDEPLSEDREKAEDIMEGLGCLHLAGRPYGSLSQGERQRILICRGLMGSPEILILDEPCTGLDIIARQSLLNSLEHIDRHERPPTLIYVSHHIEEIMPVFSHILLLRQGEVHSAGRKEELLTEQNLTDFFGMPLEVEWRNDRAWVRI